MPLHTNPRSVHGFVGFEIIQRAAGAPGPRAQRTPIVQLAGLTLVHQPDDAVRQTCAVVRLYAAGRQDRVAPTFRQNLLLPGGSGWSRRRTRRTCTSRANTSETEFHN